MFNARFVWIHACVRGYVYTRTEPVWNTYTSINTYQYNGINQSVLKQDEKELCGIAAKNTDGHEIGEKKGIRRKSRMFCLSLFRQKSWSFLLLLLQFLLLLFLRRKNKHTQNHFKHLLKTKFKRERYNIGVYS